MFSKHIPALYSPKPTLATLYAEDNTLFGSMTFPEGLEGSTVTAFLLHRYGSLDTLYSEASEAKSAFALWSSVMLPNWTRMWEALQAEYAPLENYDMTEQMTNDATTKTYGKSTTRTDNLTHTKTGYDTDANERGVYGFNSPADTPVQDSTGTNRADYNTTESDGGTQGVAESGSDTETRNYLLTRSGNIGVTTSQQMLESEIELRSKWNMCEIIGLAFMREFCVAVW